MYSSKSNPHARPVLYNNSIIDTGATRHITSNRSLLKHIVQMPKPIKIRTSCNHTLTCTHTGTARITCLQGATILLYNVLLSPEANTPNLFSVSRAQASNTNLEVVLTHTAARFHMGNTQLLNASKHKNLYLVPTVPFDHRQFDVVTGQDPGTPDIPVDTTKDFRTHYTPLTQSPYFHQIGIDVTNWN